MSSYYSREDELELRFRAEMLANHWQFEKSVYKAMAKYMDEKEKEASEFNPEEFYITFPKKHAPRKRSKESSPRYGFIPIGDPKRNGYFLKPLAEEEEEHRPKKECCLKCLSC